MGAVVRISGRDRRAGRSVEAVEPVDDRAAAECVPLICHITGFFPDEDRVIYGVLYGAYRAGGIALERLDYLTDRGKIRKGEIEVLCEGVLFPEIILAADKSADQNKLASFRRRLLLISGNVPPPLHQDLLSIGISNFVEPCNKTLGLFREIESHLSSGLTTQRN